MQNPTPNSSSDSTGCCRNELKQNENRFIHHDIRPYEQLDGVEKLDMEFSRYLCRGCWK
jgi:hypothetical protein